MSRPAAVITGSATGVGAATALLLARRGWDVAINYSKSEAEARGTQAACEAAGARTVLVRGNVAEDADCRALVQAAADAFGRIDALVNNAGVSVFGAAAGWDALDADAFHRIYAVNTISTVTPDDDARLQRLAIGKRQNERAVFVDDGLTDADSSARRPLGTTLTRLALFADAGIKGGGLPHGVQQPRWQVASFFGRAYATV